MNTKEYVASLFAGYEKSGGLEDFMEEIESNMNARVGSLVRKGMPMGEAFIMAASELGDVSQLARDLSLKKRREVFEDAYLDIRRCLSPRRVTAYVIFGVTALFGVTVSLISYFAAGEAVGGGAGCPLWVDSALFDSRGGGFYVSWPYAGNAPQVHACRGVDCAGSYACIRHLLFR